MLSSNNHSNLESVERQLRLPYHLFLLVAGPNNKHFDFVENCAAVSLQHRINYSIPNPTLLDGDVLVSYLECSVRVLAPSPQHMERALLILNALLIKALQLCTFDILSLPKGIVRWLIRQDSTVNHSVGATTSGGFLGIVQYKTMSSISLHSDSSGCIVRIAGTEAAVQQASKAIDQRVQQLLSSNTTHHHSIQDTGEDVVYVPHACSHLLHSQSVSSSDDDLYRYLDEIEHLTHAQLRLHTSTSSTTYSENRLQQENQRPKIYQKRISIHGSPHARLQAQYLLTRLFMAKRRSALLHTIPTEVVMVFGEAFPHTGLVGVHRHGDKRQDQSGIVESPSTPSSLNTGPDGREGHDEYLLDVIATYTPRQPSHSHGATVHARYHRELGNQGNVSVPVLSLSHERGNGLEYAQLSTQAVIESLVDLAAPRRPTSPRLVDMTQLTPQRNHPVSVSDAEREVTKNVSVEVILGKQRLKFQNDDPPAQFSFPGGLKPLCDLVGGSRFLYRLDTSSSSSSQDSDDGSLEVMKTDVLEEGCGMLRKQQARLWYMDVEWTHHRGSFERMSTRFKLSFGQQNVGSECEVKLEECWTQDSVPMVMTYLNTPQFADFRIQVRQRPGVSVTALDEGLQVVLKNVCISARSGDGESGNTGFSLDYPKVVGWKHKAYTVFEEEQWIRDQTCAYVKRFVCTVDSDGGASEGREYGMVVIKNAKMDRLLEEYGRGTGTGCTPTSNLELEPFLDRPREETKHAEEQREEMIRAMWEIYGFCEDFARKVPLEFH